MTPCYEPLKNMLIALGNTFEVIGMQKNNILGEKKHTKKRYFFKKNTVQGVLVSPGSVTPVYLILGWVRADLNVQRTEAKVQSATTWCGTELVRAAVQQETH